ncbi:MAG: AAA family ATPase [Kiritimatiellaeota bacterium]|nr:AAA family ATPase [Kiritimatiellota bacterium]
MSHIIAITGKGGVGKTTLSALIVTRLIATGHTPVLAVDADPNSCLDASLGVKAEHTIGGVREEAREIAGKGMAAGISKQELLEFKIGESLVEADDFDLIAMGRPEGPGCYCYANSVLKQAIGTIADSYPYVVIDNEAGLENLSRRIVKKVDLMIMVADPSMRGIETLERLHELTNEMDIEYGKLALIVNRMRKKELPRTVVELGKRIEADHLIGLPDDEEIADFAEKGKNLMLISEKNTVAIKIDELLKLGTER